MKLDPIAGNSSSITKSTNEFELDNYTIFVGKNNAGKTHFLKGLKAKLGESNVIYIPAEKIHASEELKVTAATDPMRSALNKLLVLEYKSIEINFEEVNKLITNINTNFNQIKVEGVSLDLKKEDLDIDKVKGAIIDLYAKNILESMFKDTYFDKDTDRKIDEVSQGTQRVLIASVLQELGKQNIGDSNIHILFEEPEIYLHPCLKKRLHTALVELSQKDNVKVIISTHDPYFIELGSNNTKIYEVFRNQEKENSTDVKSIDASYGVLGYTSHDEINYLVFGLESDSYFLELYNKLLGTFIDTKYFEDKRASSNSEEELDNKKLTDYNLLNTWLKEKSARMVGSNVIISKKRHLFAHRSVENLEKEITKEDIEEVKKFLSICESERK